MSSFVTGEAVVLDVRTAALPSRLLAAIVDGIIQIALLMLFFFMIGLFAGTGSDDAFLAIAIVAYVSVGLGYPVMFETLMRGRTPGKAALGLRVVRGDAGPVGFRQAFVRGLIGLLIERPGVTSGAAAVISSLIDSRGRRLGDLAAGTMVIQERVIAPTAAPLPMPPPLADWASTADLSALSDELALSIRSFLARSSSLTETARSQLGGQLGAAVSAVVSPPPPPGTPGWAYLTAVLAERRRREEIQHFGYGLAPVATWPAQPPTPFPGSATGAFPAPGPTRPSSPPAAPAPAPPQSPAAPPAPPSPPTAGGFHPPA